MKRTLLIPGFLFCLLRLNGQNLSSVPGLVKQGNQVQLLVDSRPFLVLGGELGNSTDEFYVAGTGIVMTFIPKSKNKKAGFLHVEEGTFENEKRS